MKELLQKIWEMPAADLLFWLGVTVGPLVVVALSVFAVWWRRVSRQFDERKRSYAKARGEFEATKRRVESELRAGRRAS